MAKRSEIIGEFIVTIADNNSVSVCRIPKNTKDALRKIWRSGGKGEAPASWTTHDLGRHILNELCGGAKEATIGEYSIEREDNNRINVIKTYSTTKDGLRDAADAIGFDYDKAWTTQQFGKKLLDFVADNESAAEQKCTLKFKITSKTTVAALKEQFAKEVGAVLRVYQGRSEAADDATLVSLGAKEGELECRRNRTVGKFEEALLNDLNLKAKVYTKDNWVKVLDGITLATAAKLPNGMTKAKMEEFISYKRDEKEEAAEVEEETVTSNEDASDCVELFKDVIPVLRFTSDEKRYAVEHGDGIVLMARELKNFSNFEILSEYAENEDMMVLIAISKTSDHCAAVDDMIGETITSIKWRLEEQGVTSLEDYKFYYTTLERSTDDEEIFIENEFCTMYLNKNRSGLYEDQEFDRPELLRTINGEYRHSDCSSARLDIFNGKNCIYSCDGVVVWPTTNQ